MATLISLSGLPGVGKTTIARALITRDMWTKAAVAVNTRLLNVEVICADRTEHRRRVETRASDIEGLIVPTWDEVEARYYEPWKQPRIVIDSGKLSVNECVSKIVSELDS